MDMCDVLPAAEVRLSNGSPVGLALGFLVVAALAWLLIQFIHPPDKKG